MGQPTRHGHGGISQVPTPLSRQPGRIEQAPSAVKQISAKQVQDFLAALPSPDLQQLSFNDAICFDVVNAVTDARLYVTGYGTPPGVVWVLTDVFFYGQAPATGMNAPSMRIPMEAFNGLLRFELLIGEIPPMQISTDVVSPPAGSTRTRGGRRAGWPYIGVPFGTQRETSFALYVPERARVSVLFSVDEAPRFPITMIGLEVHGFSVPAVVLRDIWRGKE